MMRAVVMTDVGGPDVLEIREVPVPTVGARDVLVAIAATAVNRADLIQRRGFYPAPPGSPRDILGLEFAGTVEAVGADVRGVAVGDDVMGIAGGGTYAEKIAIDYRQLIPVPRGIALVDAAAIPEAFLTAWDAAFLQMDLQMGESLVIHAVASGVGTAAVQLAKAGGLYTIGTSRTAGKFAAVEALGLDVSIVTDGTNFADAVRDATGGDGADAVLDLVGGGYMAQSLLSLNRGGRLIVVGLISGRQADLDLGLVLRQRLTITGTVLRTRPPEAKATLAQLFSQRVVPLFERGLLAPVIHSTLPMAEVRQAHTSMENNANTGKIVLSW